MWFQDKSGIGERVVSGIPFLDLLDEDDDILSKTSNLMTARIVQGVLGVASLVLLRTIPVLQKTNADIGDSNVNLSYGPADSSTPASYAVPVALPGSLLGAFPGLEFDEAAQSLFDDMMTKAMEAAAGPGNGGPLLVDQVIEAISKAVSEHVAPGSTDDAQRVRKALGKLRGRLAEFIEKGRVEEAANKYLAKQLAKLRRKYGYRQCTVATHLTMLNLTSGATSKSTLTQQVFNWSDSQRDDTAVVPDTSLPLVALGQAQLVTVRLELSYTTGIRELVKKGMAAYEEAAPLTKTAAARYGELGEKAGKKADELVIKLLSQRIRAEEPDTVAPSRQILFFRNGDATAQAAAEEMRSSFPTKYSTPYPLRGGAVGLAIGSGASALTLPVLRVGP